VTERVYVLRDQAVKDRFKVFVDSLPNEKLWEVAVRPHRSKRSLEQNALLHALLREIAAETGNEPGDVKDFFKDRYGPKKIVRIGEEEKLLSKGTSEYSTEEMAEFIDRCQAWAAQEMGVFA
jgi:hypothetical protein